MSPFKSHHNVLMTSFHWSRIHNNHDANDIASKLAARIEQRRKEWCENSAFSVDLERKTSNTYDCAHTLDIIAWFSHDVISLSPTMSIVQLSRWDAHTRNWVYYYHFLWFLDACEDKNKICPKNDGYCRPTRLYHNHCLSSSLWFHKKYILGLKILCCIHLTLRSASGCRK